jgi:hypothetical protein
MGFGDLLKKASSIAEHGIQQGIQEVRSSLDHHK